VFSPSFLTITSNDWLSCNAFSSQNVACGPPRAVKQFGCTSLAIFAICNADLYVSVVDVIPTMSGLRELISFLNCSYDSLSAWQSIMSTLYWFFSKTAAKYPKPNGMNGGC